MKEYLFSREQRKFIKERRYKISINDIVDVLNKYFKTSFSRKQVVCYLRSRMYKMYKKSVSKKPQTAPLYSEKIRNGNIYIKILDNKKAGKFCWKLKHHLIWEQASGQTVPEGYKLIFLDGNKYNIQLYNLELITGKENLDLNKRKLKSKYPEATKTGIAIVRHRLAIYKKLSANLGKRESRNYRDRMTADVKRQSKKLKEKYGIGTNE